MFSFSCWNLICSHTILWLIHLLSHHKQIITQSVWKQTKTFFFRQSWSGSTDSSHTTARVWSNRYIYMDYHLKLRYEFSTTGKLLAKTSIKTYYKTWSLNKTIFSTVFKMNESRPRTPSIVLDPSCLKKWICTVVICGCPPKSSSTSPYANLETNPKVLSNSLHSDTRS